MRCTEVLYVMGNCNLSSTTTLIFSDEKTIGIWIQFVTTSHFYSPLNIDLTIYKSFCCHRIGSIRYRGCCRGCYMPVGNDVRISHRVESTLDSVESRTHSTLLVQDIGPMSNLLLTVISLSFAITHLLWLNKHTPLFHAGTYDGYSAPPVYLLVGRISSIWLLLIYP